MSYSNPLLHRPSRGLPKRVVIIGAGTIGPDIGYYLKTALPDLSLYLVDVAQGCGRDASYLAPPAQIRTCSFPAYGSYLESLTAMLRLGQGGRIRGRGGHSFITVAWSSEPSSGCPAGYGGRAPAASV